MLKPIQNASSPASLGLKDEDEDDGEGEDGEGDGEKADPANVNPERLKAFNVRSLVVHVQRSAFYFLFFFSQPFYNVKCILYMLQSVDMVECPFVTFWNVEKCINYVENTLDYVDISKVNEIYN